MQTAALAADCFLSLILVMAELKCDLKTIWNQQKALVVHCDLISMLTVHARLMMMRGFNGGVLGTET